MRRAWSLSRRKRSCYWCIRVCVSQTEVTAWVTVLTKDPGTSSVRTNLFLTGWANRSLQYLKMDAEKQIFKSLKEFGSCRNSCGPEEDWDFLQSLLTSWYSYAACGASSEYCILAAQIDFSAVPVDSLYTRPLPAWFPGVCSVGSIVCSRFALRSLLVEPVRWRPMVQRRNGTLSRVSFAV